MRRGLPLFAAAVALLLTACGPSGVPAPAYPASGVAAAPSSGGMDPLAAGAIGAAAGYMLGNASANRAQTVRSAPRTVIVNKTVINRPVYRAPSRSFSSGRRR